MRKVAFLPQAFDEFNVWAKENKKIYAKIVALIKDIQRDPFSGLGKPEALKYDLSGLWSRRINHEHRLVYRITDEEIVIVSCRFHY
jgi:toxin YoeB